MKTFLLFFNLTFSVVMFGQSKLDSGLIAYYPLNNNIKDSSKNKLDGSLISGSYTSDRFGNENYALFCDGNDYAEIKGFGKNFPIGDFSLCLWAKSIINVTSNTLMLMSDNPSNRVALSLYYSHNGQGAFFWDYGNVSSRIFIEPVAPNGHWEFFVVYYDSKSSKIGLYKDLILLQEAENKTPYLADALQTLNIGMGKDGYYNGSLDDIRFYNRLLDSSEIRDLFKMKSAGVKKNTKIDTQIKIIPDPYQPKIFYIQTQKQLNSVTVHTILGQTISQSGNNTIDLSHQLDGIYFIRFSDSEGNVYVKKVLI